jgi:alpha-tubulin suppressor-like RCC1 family protein
LGISKQKPFAWGFSQFGITEAPSLVEGLEKIIKVSVGQSNFAAIDSQGSLYTWGLNLDGALGRKTYNLNALPEINHHLKSVNDIQIGNNFMIALSRDHKLYSWAAIHQGS